MVTRDFKPAEVFTYTEQRLRCPDCGGGDWAVGHILDEEYSSFGPWYCSDCLQGWSGRNVDGVISLARAEKQVRQTVLLEIRPTEEPIRFRVSVPRVRFHKDQQEHEDGIRYYYEEHTCPTNWFGLVDQISVGEDTDPHGFVEVVSIEDG